MNRPAMIRRVLLALVTAAAAAVFAPVASAHNGTGMITCTSATYNYTDFGDGTQRVAEVVEIDGATIAQTDFCLRARTRTQHVNVDVPQDGRSPPSRPTRSRKTRTPR